MTTLLSSESHRTFGTNRAAGAFGAALTSGFGASRVGAFGTALTGALGATDVCGAAVFRLVVPFPFGTY